MLKAGDRIPPFVLDASDGRSVSAAGLRGQRFVLFFYPKDDTPTCTKEACSFRDRMPDFSRASVPVFGISADPIRSHQRFASKYSLNFPLLSDPERRTIEGFGVWVEKTLYGRRYMGIARSTFVVGADGRIEHVWEKVSAEGHADDVLAVLTGKAAARPRTKAKTPVAARKPESRGASKKTAATPRPPTRARKKPAPGARKAVQKSRPVRRSR
jgi:peroxiredoxin Q/BCP